MTTPVTLPNGHLEAVPPTPLVQSVWTGAEPDDPIAWCKHADLNPSSSTKDRPSQITLLSTNRRSP